MGHLLPDADLSHDRRCTVVGFRRPLDDLLRIRRVLELDRDGSLVAGIDNRLQILLDWCHTVTCRQVAVNFPVAVRQVDMADDPGKQPQPIHLGFRLGVRHLRAYLKSLQEIGVNHVALNLRFNQADIEKTLKHLAAEILQDCSEPGFIE